MATNIFNVLIMNVIGGNNAPNNTSMDALVSAVEVLTNSTAEIVKKAVTKDKAPPVALEDKEIIEITMMEPSHEPLNSTIQNIISEYVFAEHIV